MTRLDVAWQSWNIYKQERLGEGVLDWRAEPQRPNRDTFLFYLSYASQRHLGFGWLYQRKEKPVAELYARVTEKDPATLKNVQRRERRHWMLEPKTLELGEPVVRSVFCELLDLEMAEREGLGTESVEYRDDAQRVFCKGQLTDGKRSGLWSYFVEDRLVWKVQYAEGFWDGPYEAFHGNGATRERGVYKRDERTGTWTSFRSNGDKLREGPFTRGLAHGLFRYWSEEQEVSTMRHVYGEPQ